MSILQIGVLTTWWMVTLGGFVLFWKQRLVGVAPCATFPYARRWVPKMLPVHAQNFQHWVPLVQAYPHCVEHVSTSLIRCNTRSITSCNCLWIFINMFTNIFSKTYVYKICLQEAFAPPTWTPLTPSLLQVARARGPGRGCAGLRGRNSGHTRALGDRGRRNRPPPVPPPPALCLEGGT